MLPDDLNPIGELFTVEQVLAKFPKGHAPGKARFEDFLETHGCYRDVFGKKLMTVQDVTEAFALLRAVPNDKDAKAQLGAGRLLLMRPTPDQPGYMVIIGDQLGDDEQLYVGWAPLHGPGDLLKLVQFGNPGHLAILHWFPATPSDVAAQKAVIWKYRLRTDTDTWFARTPDVQAWITALREDTFSDVEDDDADDDNTGE